MKEESRVDGKGPYEFGTFGGKQGKRTDLDEASETLKTDGMLGVAKNHPSSYIKYHQGFKALDYMLSSEVSSSALRNVDVTCIWGAPGTGKTRFGWDLSQFMNVPAYRLMPPTGRTSQLWFDGYEDQKMLIIDEMAGEWMPWNFFMNLLDVYPLQLPVKGSHKWARFTTILITSNTEPTAWYAHYSNGMDKEALARRLTTIYRSEKMEIDGAMSYRLLDSDGDLVDRQEVFENYKAANEKEAIVEPVVAVEEPIVLQVEEDN